MRLIFNFLTKKLWLFFILTSTTCAFAGIELVSTNNIDIGKIYNHYHQVHEFDFINTGKKDFNFLRVITTCSCITDLNKIETLKSGERYSLKVDFDASTVDGKFSRGMWVFTDDPDNAKMLLRISGEVLPLFTGVPNEEIILQSALENVVFTNKFTIIGTTSDFVLGTPTCAPDSSITFDWQKDDNASSNIWHLTTRITAAEETRQRELISIPVVGPQNAHSINIRYKLIVGTSLRVSPSKLIKQNRDTGFSMNIAVLTYSSEENTELFKWEPKIEGLNLAFAPYERKSRTSKSQNYKSRSRPRTRYVCSITCTAQAFEKILSMDNPGITISYPEHKETFLPIECLETPPTMKAQPEK